MRRKFPPPFGDSEVWVVEQTLKERYGEVLPLEVATGEIRLDPDSQDLTTVPAMYWSARSAKFVIFKTGPERFRAQFFYRGYEQFGTGKQEFDNVGDCVVTLLQVQADHEHQLSQRKKPEGELPPGTQTAPNQGPEEEWIYQPVIWE